MRKFQPPLEGVLRVRTLAVRSREVDLARARGALEKAERARRETEAEIRLSLQGAPRGTVVQIRTLLDKDAELRQLRMRLGREDEHFSVSNARVDQERNRLLAARKEARAVEKLQARRYVEFLHMVTQLDQKATDEVAARTVRVGQAA